MIFKTLNGSVTPDGLILPVVDYTNNTGNFFGYIYDNSTVLPTLRLGNLTADTFNRSDFANGNFSYIDGNDTQQTLKNINGSILNGTVPNATFAPGVTSTNGTIKGTFKADIR